MFRRLRLGQKILHKPSSFDMIFPKHYYGKCHLTWLLLEGFFIRKQIKEYIQFNDFFEYLIKNVKKEKSFQNCVILDSINFLQYWS